MNMTIRHPSFVLSALAVLFLGGCATQGARPEAVPQTAEARAAARWEALLSKNYPEAFTYLSPGVRSGTTAERYGSEMGVRPVRWKGATVISSECPTDETCNVTVNIQFDVPSSHPQLGRIGSEAPVTERWIKLDGVWYFVPRHVTLGN